MARQLCSLAASLAILGPTAWAQNTPPSDGASETASPSGDALPPVQSVAAAEATPSVQVPPSADAGQTNTEQSPAAENDSGVQESAAHTRKVREERESSGVALALKISTLGVGLEGIYNINRYINVRGQVNGFDFNHTLDKDGNPYKGQIKFLTGGALGDVYPFAGVPVVGLFRLTAGVYDDQNKINLNASCQSGCNAGNLTITSTGPDPANLIGKLDFHPFAPYAGFGFGNAMQGGHLHFAFDIGVLLDGKPKIDLHANGGATITNANTSISYTDANVGTDPVVSQQVAVEQQKLAGEVKNYQIYPVIAFTVGYRFSF